MTELDPSLILKAFATPQIDLGGLVQKRAEIQRQQMLQQREDADYQSKQADAASQKSVVQQYGTDPVAARKSAFATGNPQLVQQLDQMDDAGRKRTIEVSQSTAPLLMSLKNVPPEQIPQAMQALAPQLQARGFTPDHIAQVQAQLADPTQRDAAFNGILSSAQTIAEYQKQNEIKGYAAGTHLFQGSTEVGSVPDKPDVQIVEGPNGFYSVDKRTNTASPVTVGGSASPAGSSTSAHTAPPAALINVATGGKGTISSGFGPRAAPSPGASTFHNGVDVALPAGSPVASAADGTVIQAWNDTKHGGGNSVVVRHNDGSVTGYADLGDYNVKVGQQVHAGQQIGTAGSSGSTSTGSHLHFTYRGAGGAAQAGGQQLQGKPKPEADAPPPMDASTIDYVAQQYKATGQLPPLGMGKQAAAMRAQIIGRAAQLAKADGTFSDAAGLHADFKANSAALSTLQRTTNQVLAYERTAGMNADQVLQTMGKGAGTTGVPVFNKWQQAGRRAIAGDPDVSRFNLAVQTFATEYARVTSGATGGAVTSDSARHEMMGLINNAQTPDQLRAVIDQAKKEMGNRRKGLNDQANALRDSMKSRPGAQQANKPTVSNW